MKRSELSGIVLAFVWVAVFVLALLETAGRGEVRAQRLSSKDAIIACLEKDGVLVYAMTDKGPPQVGQTVTADMFAIVCVGEK